MLHLLGIDHKRLTVKFQGLDVRLTGIVGRSGQGDFGREFYLLSLALPTIPAVQLGLRHTRG